MRFFWLLGISVGASLGAMAQDATNQIPAPAVPPSFTLWQLPSQSHSQIMSYVVRSTGGKLVVIDGGTRKDAPYLRDFIRARGGHVEAWFATHPHDDHVEALEKTLREPDGLEIKALYASMPDAAWMKEVSDPSELNTYTQLMEALAQANRAFEPLQVSQTLDLDGIHIEVLGVANPEFRKNPLNNSSLVLRFSDASKSVLFLADLGFQGGQKLLNGPMADRLPSDYVQMAHHGQNGVSEAFYKKVNPKYCLWPTPKWLWDNDSGAGPGSGHWRTLEVRGWMEKLPIRKHYPMFEGLQTIE
jgi:beta-lactamase superfamily II metal-dependent hydrolase